MLLPTLWMISDVLIYLFDFCFSAAIFLGSFRMPYCEIRRMIVEVDEDQLTEPMIQVRQDLHKVVKKKKHYCISFLTPHNCEVDYCLTLLYSYSDRGYCA